MVSKKWGVIPGSLIAESFLGPAKKTVKRPSGIVEILMREGADAVHGKICILFLGGIMLRAGGFQKHVAFACVHSPDKFCGEAPPQPTLLRFGPV